MAEGDELWFDDVDLDDRFERENQDDEWFDLVERAERVCDDHASWTAQVLARYVSSLKVGIAQTTNDGLKKQMKNVRWRLLTVLFDRNAKRVDDLLRHINEQLGDAERHLSLAQEETMSTREVNEHFDIVEGSFSLAVSSFSELQTRKYLQEFAKKRAAEVELLRERLAQLREQYKVRSQVVRAARERDDAAARELQERVQRVTEEMKQAREDAIAACRTCLEKGDFVGAGEILANIEPEKTKLARKPNGIGYVVVPDDPVLADLDNLFVQLSITEAVRLKGFVGVSMAESDFVSSMQHIAAIEVLDQRAITKVFGGVEQVAMLKQRCHRQVSGVRRNPRDIPRLK